MSANTTDAMAATNFMAGSPDATAWPGCLRASLSQHSHLVVTTEQRVVGPCITKAAYPCHHVTPRMPVLVRMDQFMPRWAPIVGFCRCRSSSGVGETRERVHVPQYQDAVQFRAAGDKGRNPRLRIAIR